MGPSRCRPRLSDAAAGDEIFRRARRQQEELPPVFAVGLPLDAQRADQAFM
jgi:hypothetical protein